MMVHLSNWLEGDMAVETPAVVQELCYSLLLQLLRHHPQLFADSGLTLHMNMLLKGAGHASSQVLTGLLRPYLSLRPARCRALGSVMLTAAATPPACFHLLHPA